MNLLLLLSIPCLIHGLEKKITMTSELHEMQLNNSAGILAALDMMPKECSKNGKTFKVGEEFEFGKLRYKCQNYGVYSIEGCVGKDKKPMKIGESQVVDNVKYQCLAMGNSIYFRETTCGIMGQPDCDKIPLPTGLQDAMAKNGGKAEQAQPEGTTKVGGVELPKGWRLVDGGTKQITGTNASVVTQILQFNPISSRARRQSGHGVGRVIGVEDMSGGDPSRPASSMAGVEKMGGKGVIGTQTVGANLKMIKKGDKHDVDLVDLNERHDQRMEGADKMKPGSVSGHQSITDWKGKTIQVNGKSIGAGPGTFSFGNRPTNGGIFLKKDD